MSEILTDFTGKTDVAGEITEETILRQCITMSKNSRLDAFMWYFGSIGSFDVDVKLDTQYLSDTPHNTIYAAKHSSIFDSKPLNEILKDLIAIEYEYAEDNKNE